MKILAVETSAGPSSVALTEGGALLGELYTRTKSVHSRTLMPGLQALLNACDTAIGDVGLFAVSAGPGSFTGIRIGISAAKGLAMVHDTPCASVSTLEAIAYGANWLDGIICAVMDARCGQVYTALFEPGTDGPVRLTPDAAVSVAELEKELAERKKNTILVGDGAGICYNQLKERARIRLAPETLCYQRASSVAFLAQKAYEAGKLTTAEQLTPVYLRRPQAERERIERAQHSKSN